MVAESDALAFTHINIGLTLRNWGKEVLVPLPHFQQICWCGSFCLEHHLKA